MEQLLRDRYKIILELKMQISQAQHTMKQQADMHHRATKFDIQVWVYLKLRTYRQKNCN